jgi:hypothetical protein
MVDKKTRTTVTAEPSRTNRSVTDIQLKTQGASVRNIRASVPKAVLMVGDQVEAGGKDWRQRKPSRWESGGFMKLDPDLCADDVRRLETLWALEQVKFDCLALV